MRVAGGEMSEPNIGGIPVSDVLLLGVSSKVALAGAVGSAVGMVLGEGRWWERVTRGTVGVASAWVGHGFAAKIMVGLFGVLIDAKYLPSASDAEPVAAFVIGLVGMIACQAAINYMGRVRDLADDVADKQLTGSNNPPPAAPPAP